ncbi:MAG: AAA-like domain-containing protein [bacterium]
MLGKTVSHYKILQELDHGGMGTVYKAEDIKLRRAVALKFLRPELTLDKEAKARFMREAQAVSRLDHQNICTVYEIDENKPGGLFIAMAYYDGETVQKKVARGKLPVNEAVDIAAQAARGLAIAHSKKIVHRDIKPANIMITRDGVVKILDFGLAKLVHQQEITKDITKEHTAIGTVHYMSPEQAHGLKVDGRTDIWSLGVLMYEMLTGQRPFKGDNLLAVLYAIRHEQAEKLTHLRTDLPDSLVRVIEKSLSKDRAERYHTAGALLAELENLVPMVSASAPGLSPITRRRIFLSYKRNVEPDQSVAMQIYEALRQHHQVFIDRNMIVGARWVERIMRELQQTDYLVILLSAHSIQSEMVRAEIQTAHELARQKGGKPRILPVRLAFREPFPYHLRRYLDPINWALWDGPEETPRLIQELTAAIEGREQLPISTNEKANVIRAGEAQALLPPLPELESPEGTMDPHSAFYIERPSDLAALETIQRQGVTITIKAPRQMGKSSLLLRTIKAAQALGKRTVFLDFQQFDKSALGSADRFFQQFCAWLTYKLQLENRVDEYWQIPLGNIQRCTSFVEDHLLQGVKQPLVLGMDEVESIFDTDFRTDFFGMLRSWHNSRQEGSSWRKLDLVLVTSTEPYQLIENLNLSPFNVGEVIELTDFALQDVAELNRRHRSPLSAKQEKQLLHLVGGQPFLVRRTLYCVASGRMTYAELVRHAAEESGPFGDHLRHHLWRLQGKNELIAGLKQVIRKHECEDDHVYFRLRGAGLVRKEGRSVLPRCQLYADYFKDHLNA